MLLRRKELIDNSLILCNLRLNLASLPTPNQSRPMGAALDVVQQGYAAFGRKDIPALLKLVADQVESLEVRRGVSKAGAVPQRKFGTELSHFRELNNERTSEGGRLLLRRSDKLRCPRCIAICHF